VAVAAAACLAAKAAASRRAVPPGAPPGSFGLPLVGECPMRALNASAWLDTRVAQYGSVFRSHLFFRRTVVLLPTEANVAFFTAAEAEGCLHKAMPPAMRCLFGHRGLFNQPDGADRTRVRASMGAHLCGGSVLGMAAPLEALVRRRVKRWRRLSGELRGRGGDDGTVDAPAAAAAAPEQSPRSTIPAGASPVAGADWSTCGGGGRLPIAGADWSTCGGGGLFPMVADSLRRRQRDALGSPAASPASPQQHRGAVPPLAAPRPWPWSLLPSGKTPPAEPSFLFESEARALVAAMIVHVIFGEASLSTADRKLMCERLSVVRAGLEAVSPVPFFGTTALERGAAARAEVVDTIRGLILQRRRQVDAFQERPVCLLDSIIGWVDTTGTVLTTDKQVDYVLDLVFVALHCTGSVLNGVVYDMARNAARWDAIRDQCEAVGVYDGAKGINPMRLARTALLDEALLDLTTALAPIEWAIRVVRRGNLRLGPFVVPRGWSVMQRLPVRMHDGGCNSGMAAAPSGEGARGGCPMEGGDLAATVGPTRAADEVAAARSPSATSAPTKSPTASPRATPPERAADVSPASGHITAPTVPPPSRWPCMGVGVEKSCPAADTAILLVKIVCLVLLRDCELELAPGAYCRTGVHPLSVFKLRVHRR